MAAMEEPPDPTAARKVMDWYAQDLARETLQKDEAKRTAKSNTKPLASVIIATALFGVLAFLPDGEPTKYQIYNTFLIFGAAATAVACYRSLTSG
jgi:hypothetical protein